MGRPKQYPIRLTDQEVEYLTTLLRNGKEAAIARRRADMLLHLDQNHGEVLSVKEIAQRCGVSSVTLYQLSRKVSKEGLSDDLFKRKKHNYPPQFVTGDVEAKVIALACSQPPEGYDRWTVRLLANKVVLEEEQAISPTTIARILKKHR